jgi:hypothetical protein
MVEQILHQVQQLLMVFVSTILVPVALALVLPIQVIKDKVSGFVGFHLT